MPDGGRRRRRRRALLLTAAATAPLGASTRASWFLSSGGVAVLTPAPVAPPRAGLGPVVPRPGRYVVPRPAPHGTPLETSPPPAVCGGYGNPRQITPGAV